ncbi:MAG: hypothetical protein ACRCT6_11530 [Notoacmeibacter sp.]
MQNNNAAPTVSAGDFEITLVKGGIGAVFWHGVEVLRGAACLIRDANWGTFQVENFTQQNTLHSNGNHKYTQRFSIHQQAAFISLNLNVDPKGQLELTTEITANSDLVTNRAGFVVLHPIATTAGTDLAITHPDGSATETRFPKFIAPGQPAKNISGLSHQIGNIGIELEFSGEIFEMEDQRNWSDASFKTYCRPLSLPFPYVLKAGQTIRQGLVLKVNLVETNQELVFEAETKTGVMPQILLAVEADWLPEKSLWPQFKSLCIQGLLLRVHAVEFETDIWHRTFEFAKAISTPIDLELVLSGEDFAPQIDGAAKHCANAGINPRHVMVLPELWLGSYQPEQGPSLACLKQCISDAKAAFPAARIGAGMLTNFTELNRYPVTGGDYITHGNTAIVHAADDVSVWQTLEALPHVFASGQMIADQRGYRLGLVSIGMRTNPYGAALADNPDRHRVAMAGEDPRQQEFFAAAYGLGAAIEASLNGVEAIALAAPIGRFGLMDENGPYPIFEAVKALAKLSGRMVKPLSGLPEGVIGIEAEGGVQIIANCSAQNALYDGQSLAPGAWLCDGIIQS